MTDTNEQTYGNTCEAIIRSSKRITDTKTDEVREMVLTIHDPAFRAMPGQNIGVLVEGKHPFGNRFHHRYYSVLAAQPHGEGSDIEILVRRCSYIDEVSGEEYPGIASHYLCDAAPGKQITLTGPYKAAFKVPADNTSNLLMIGTGTGIAPFRTLIKSVYAQEQGWRGQVRLFYGAKSGLDALYMNDQNNDITNYYDQATFEAYQAIDPQSWRDASGNLGKSLAENGAKTWVMMQMPNTYVYLAGLKKQVAVLDKVMGELAGSAANWQALKNRLVADGRWAELVY